ncbi:MAG: hypothetical protein AB4372_21215 [Xenococcus sp. (in: cyanobacteria)]
MGRIFVFQAEVTIELMDKQMNRKLVIYNQISETKYCLDGLASAWITYRSFGNNADYLSWHFDNFSLPDFTNYNEVFIIDCAFPEDMLEDWAEKGKSIVVIDHHISTFLKSSNFNNNIKQVFELNESGATLSWKTIFGDFETMPPFLLYIKDIDLHCHELINTEIVDTAISILLLRLEQFGSLRLKMIFTFFDYLATLSESELLEYLSLATGLNL